MKNLTDLYNSRKPSSMIPGGKASGKSPSEYPADQLRKGIKVELEHTPSRKRAREISMDHLEEFPKYYDALATMEKELKKKASDDDDMSGPAPSVEVVKAFLKKNPNPTDEQFHEWAKSKGYNIHKAEAAAYRIATEKVATDSNPLFAKTLNSRTKYIPGPKRISDAGLSQILESADVPLSSGFGGKQAGFIKEFNKTRSL